MNAPPIEIRDLHKYFGDLEVLRGISTTIQQGEVVCLLGPSGSGKSTLLRCVNRLEEATSGSILIEGEDIVEEDADVDGLRTRIGMVFQQPNPFPKSIYDNVAYAPLKHGFVTKGASCDELVEKALTNGFGEVAVNLQMLVNGSVQCQ